jgi:hypothetical protein
MRMLGTSSCSAVAAAVSTGFTQVVAGQVVPSGTAYTVVFIAAAVAALVGATIAALTPRTVAPEVLPVPAAPDSANAA